MCVCVCVHMHWCACMHVCIHVYVWVWGGKGASYRIILFAFLFQELPCHGVTVVFVELGATKIEVS